MKRHKVDSGSERRLLIAMVTSKEFLAQTERVVDLDLVDSELFKTVAKWCLDYYREYHKAPGRHITDIFHAWSESADESLSERIKDFLETLSQEYESTTSPNVPYLLDQLRDFLNKRSLIRLKESLEYSLSRGELSEAHEVVCSYRGITVGDGVGMDLGDDAVWDAAFAESSEPIITFHGDSGVFLNNVLTRDALVGIQAPEKMGKTNICLELVHQGLRQRRRIALFEVGDLSSSQITKRLGVRWAQRPLWKRLCGRIKIPSEIIFDDSLDTGYKFKNRSVEVPRPLTLKSAKEGRDCFLRGCGVASLNKHLRSSVHPNGSINVRGISGILDIWEQEHDFSPDIVVIDYADILAPENPKGEYRHQVNDTWMALRKLSQERHCLVVAPTQANATTYKHGPDRLQSMGSFSEDKRKYAHVSAMLGMNQTWEEKGIGGMRLNWIVVRESPYSSNKPLYVGTCFALGKALCCASFKR